MGPALFTFEATNDLSVNIDNGLLYGVVFIDLTKPFDTIDPEIILRKIPFLGFDQAAIRWFHSYLSGRTQRCDVNGKLSTARDLRCSVPQGNLKILHYHFAHHVKEFNLSPCRTCSMSTFPHSTNQSIVSSVVFAVVVVLA